MELVALDKLYTLDEAKAIWAKDKIALADLVAFAGVLRRMPEGKRKKLLSFDELRAKKEGVTLRTLTRLLVSYRLMSKEGLI